MGRSLSLVAFMTAAAAGGLLPVPVRAQDAPLAGVWTINRSLSESPADIGFNPSWMSTPRGDGQSAGSSAGGRGRRGSSGGGGSRGSAPPFPTHPESYDDARRLQLLAAEVRNPPARLMIVDTPTAVTITNELGQSRTLHPDGKEESIELQGVSIGVTSQRDADRLVVVYRAGKDRQIRYTYSHSSNPLELVVDVQLLDHGAGDKARRVYEPGTGTEALTSAGAGATPSSSSSKTPDTFDQRPGAELRGLTSLGMLVEDLSAQSVACGLTHDAIESALSKRLTDGGFAVRRNADDDTYLYVNIMTTSESSGLCVSRYDAFLYTHATANVSYRDQPVLVQVSLRHRGGIGSSASTGHDAAVIRGLQNFVDLFVTAIHDANK